MPGWLFAPGPLTAAGVRILGVDRPEWGLSSVDWAAQFADWPHAVSGVSPRYRRAGLPADLEGRDSIELGGTKQRAALVPAPAAPVPDGRTARSPVLRIDFRHEHGGAHRRSRAGPAAGLRVAQRAASGPPGP